MRATLRTGPTTTELPWWPPLLFALLVAASGCSNSKSDAADAPDSPNGTGGGTASGSCPGNGDRQSGSGTVSGAAEGHTFDAVASARWIGSPDSGDTTVVYLFSQPTACADLCSTGWDARVQDQNQIVELKLFGTAPGSFTVVTTATPAPGEASVNTTFVSSGNPNEQSASGGTVELGTLIASQAAQGSFSLELGADTLSGDFDAAFCPGGHEP